MKDEDAQANGGRGQGSAKPVWHSHGDVIPGINAWATETGRSIFAGISVIARESVLFMVRALCSFYERYVPWRPGPFMALSAAGGIRPGVHAG
jgi:hypothetical protein